MLRPFKDNQLAFVVSRRKKTEETHCFRLKKMILSTMHPHDTNTNPHEKAP